MAGGSRLGQRLPDGNEDGVVGEELAGVTEEVGDAPARGLKTLGFADPTGHLLDLISRKRSATSAAAKTELSDHINNFRKNGVEVESRMR